MSSLFIIGNGFDIAHGIPTAYGEFRKWLIKRYPDSLAFRETTISIEEYAELSVDEVAAETLLYAMDHAAGEEWHDFETALGRIHFKNKLPAPLPEEDDEDDPKHNEKMGKYLLRVSGLSNAIIQSAEECWAYFFSEWIKTVEKKIEQGCYAARPALIRLFSDPSNKYMSFNYTKTLQHIYKVRTVKHIHNRVGQELVFGHGNDHAKYDEPYDNDDRFPLAASTLDNFIQSLRKNTGRQLRKYSDFFRKLDTGIDRVYTYGFSYSTVDNPYIKEVIKQISPDAVWCFTNYETSQKEEIRRKKTTLRRNDFKGSFDTFEG